MVTMITGTIIYKHEIIPKPHTNQAVVEYNKDMGSIDGLDMIILLNDGSRKTK